MGPSNDALTRHKTVLFVYEHNIPQNVLFKMERLMTTLPAELMSVPVERLLRRVYTMALGGSNENYGR